MPYPATECFWVEPTGEATRTLRRYSHVEGEGTCPADPDELSYHNASLDIGISPVVLCDHDQDGLKYIAAIDVDDYRGDPRWPAQCSCGYEFTDEDSWQVNQCPIYESKDGRRTYVTKAYGRRPIPGAMYHTWWRPWIRKEDGLTITVVCPNGEEWCIDEKASSGGYWTRTGTPPKLTVTPSIIAGDYHGFLTNGVLTAG